MLTRKIKQDGTKWHQSVRDLAERLGGPVSPCYKCGAACVSGYCCFNCGNDNSISRLEAQDANT